MIFVSVMVALLLSLAMLFCLHFTLVRVLCVEEMRILNRHLGHQLWIDYSDLSWKSNAMRQLIACIVWMRLASQLSCLHQLIVLGTAGISNYYFLN